MKAAGPQYLRIDRLVAGGILEGRAEMDRQEELQAQRQRGARKER
jgi:hypothetical protein